MAFRQIKRMGDGTFDLYLEWIKEGLENIHKVSELLIKMPDLKYDKDYPSLVSAKLALEEFKTILNEAKDLGF